MPKIDPRTVLSIPRAYSLFRNLAGGSDSSKQIVENYIQARAGDRVLDIGCGTGDILVHMPDVDYVGFDLSSKYIERARRRFGHRGRFFCQRVNEQSLTDLGTFDIVVATGVVHHLDDQEAGQLFRLAHSALKEGGRLVTLDGCFVEKQSWVARRLLRWDRGQYVRNENQYTWLAESVFGTVAVSILHNLIRIPYTHIIMQCTREV